MDASRSTEAPLGEILARAAAAPRSLSQAEMAQLLSLSDEAAVARLFESAYAVKLKCCGRGVSVRGLVEAGNVCAKDCLDCGIRRSNSKVER